MTDRGGLRYRVDPGDVPEDKAARRLHLTVAEFRAKQDELFGRGFPRPDPTTGMYDLEAIDTWRRSRYPHLFPTTLTPAPTALNAKDVVRDRLRGRVVGG